MARYVLDQAEERGELKEGGIIVEATSGNTGIAFSMLAAERGYQMIVVMPSNMSEERKMMIRAYGAEIVEVGPGDFLGAVDKANEIVAEKNAYCPCQFVNDDNVKAHEVGTAVEIDEQVKELPGSPEISAFVAGTGTGGTLMGVQRAFTTIRPETVMVAVEPTESAVMQGSKDLASHAIQGIGDGFIPEIVDMDVVDEVIAISSEDSIDRTERLTKELGLLVGISSGANVLAAEKYIEEHDPEGIVVTILPDRQERYFSMMY